MMVTSVLLEADAACWEPRDWSCANNHRFREVDRFCLMSGRYSHAYLFVGLYVTNCDRNVLKTKNPADQEAVKYRS